MKVIGINGSPRTQWNTAKVLKSVLDGAASKGAETEIINLYELNYKGCISCFACKLKGGKSYGRCAVKDDLKPILDSIHESDAFVLASPIYLGSVTGEMRSMMERLIFQYLVYDKEHSSLFERKIKVGLIYTMGAPEQITKMVGYDKNFESVEALMKNRFGHAETLTVYDTYQFDDYSKYETSAFDEEHKRKVREEVFPKDLEKAFELGTGLI